MWQMRCSEIARLPKLAWLAEVDLAHRSIAVSVGSAVEHGPGFCVEGVWDGPFADARFDRAEHFFGSGVRLDADGPVFASSVAIIDRIFHVSWHGRLLVSNSLVQLLARTGARLNPNHDYTEESFASQEGIHRYPDAFHVLHPDFESVHQEYHCNLTIVDGALERAVRSAPRSFDTFEAYERAMRDVLARLGDNQRDPARRHPLAGYATVSGGYDSTAVAALVKDVGVTDCFTTASEDHPDARQRESGVPIAEALGLRVHVLNNAKGGASELEREFLAGCTDGSEVFYDDLVQHLMARGEIAALFTGYYGDVVWKHFEGEPPFDDDMRRKDVSGLNISEVRLCAGFVNVPVPQIFARNLRSIAAIGRSDAMRPWSIGTDYDRPIPRRIAETAGVPRAVFGHAKRAQLLYYTEPRNAKLRREFHRFLHEEAGLSPLRRQAGEWLRRADYAMAKLMRVETMPFSGGLHDMRSLLYVWAVNTLAARYLAAYTQPDIHHASPALAVASPS